jgi:hypothetical protein
MMKLNSSKKFRSFFNLLAAMTMAMVGLLSLTPSPLAAQAAATRDWDAMNKSRSARSTEQRTSGGGFLTHFPSGQQGQVQPEAATPSPTT